MSEDFDTFWQKIIDERVQVSSFVYARRDAYSQQCLDDFKSVCRRLWDKRKENDETDTRASAENSVV